MTCDWFSIKDESSVFDYCNQLLTEYASILPIYVWTIDETTNVPLTMLHEYATLFILIRSTQTTCNQPHHPAPRVRNHQKIEEIQRAPKTESKWFVQPQNRGASTPLSMLRLLTDAGATPAHARGVMAPVPQKFPNATWANTSGSNASRCMNSSSDWIRCNRRL